MRSRGTRFLPGVRISRVPCEKWDTTFASLLRYIQRTLALYIDDSRYIAEPLALHNLSNGPPRLVNRLIGVCVSPGIRVGDCDSPESFPRHLARKLTALQPE
jgi:hypothetical protein